VTTADVAPAADSPVDGLADEHSVVIGRPIGNTQLYILDTHGQPQPVGVPGELHIGGDGLARGYRQLPALTAEKFVRNPFGPGRLYRTGDLARYRSDGAIAYLGRIDNQVKIRGFRIELGEIESVLERHPAVRQAVVVAQPDSSGGKRLVAFLIADEPAPASEALRGFLRERLPEYMAPAAFVLLDQLPLTPNGKVDRRQLMQMATPALDLATQYVAPATALEEQLVAIWADVLKVDPAAIGTQHNFFDLGGHSLLAIQLLSRTRTTFQVELPIRDLMNNPTVAGVAALIEPLQQLASLFEGAPTTLDADRESIEL
jgi:acyl carrier protein